MVHEPLLSINDLQYSFGPHSRLLFHSLSFDVHAGEYAVVIGPNGIGKTTLLRCILRILTDWTGSIRIEGVSVRNLSRLQLARKIAYVQQTFSTVFSLTVREVVEMGRYPHLNPLAPLSHHDCVVVEQSLDVMHLNDLSNRMIDTLSGGERQRVLLASALAQEPQLLLLDEPTTFLDYKHQEEICHLLRQINRERKTTILEITHDVNRAVLNGNRLVALSEKGLAYHGPPNLMMNADALREIYDTEFDLVQHPVLGTKMIVPRAVCDK